MCVLFHLCSSSAGQLAGREPTEDAFRCFSQRPGRPSSLSECEKSASSRGTHRELLTGTSSTPIKLFLVQINIEGGGYGKPRKNVIGSGGMGLALFDPGTELQAVRAAGRSVGGTSIMAALHIQGQTT